MEKVRLNYIDWMKGIAIISVVMGHVILYNFYSVIESSNSFLFRFIYTIHMPFFIFLSGLVVNYKFESVSISYTKLLSKAKVLLTPVILIGIPYALWTGSTLYEFIISPMKYGYWYLITLFELYVLYYSIFSFSFFSCSKYEDLIKGTIIWLLFKGISHLQLNQDIINAVQFTQLITYWPFFFTAALINKYNLQEKLFSNNNLFTISLLTFGGLFIYKEYFPIINTIKYPLQFTGIFCIIYLMFKYMTKI